MFVKPVFLLVIVAAGFGLAAAPLKMQRRTVASMILIAALLHLSVQLALPHEAIEEFAQRHAYGRMGPLVLFAVGAVETFGLWGPAAVIRWATVRGRVWATIYILSVGTLGAAVYYFPYDTVIINGEVMGPKHPSYEVAFVLLLPLAAVGYLVGRVKQRMSPTPSMP
jgi:hypothetical protein